MIQRKQTLFLIVAILLISYVLFVPFVETEIFIFDCFSIEQIKIKNPIVHNTYPITIFVGITLLCHLLSIFLFKNRNIQMRFTIFSMLLAVGFYGLLVFYHFQYQKEFGIEFFMYEYPLVTPLLAAVFDFLAFKGIQKDELLVRASNRLR